MYGNKVFTSPELLSRQWSLNEPVSGMDQADLRNLLRSI